MAKLTEERARDRRQTILDAAAALFAERGFSDTSMADIVEASGVATGTVYRYFANKDAVVMAVSEGALGTRFDPDEGDPLPLDEAMNALMAAATDQRRGQISSHVWARATSSARLQTLIAERHVRVCRWLARSIDQASGDPSPAATHRAELILCAVSGLQMRVASGVEVDTDAFREGLFALAG
ncbi:TetR family transcriptional regulator [Actinoplanes sp. NPDC049548]|uniref:TetR/AcrR family transcriptional regulator n=1 Tax=Actinoplanes sp. NPDC049548 TaxID=3155152 RepID=UPI003444F431